MAGAVRIGPALRREQALAGGLVRCCPVPYVGVAARVAACREATVRFPGVAYAKLLPSVRVLCAAADGCC